MARLAPRSWALVVACFGLLLVHENIGQCAEQPPQESRSLFNGKDLTGWHADVPALDKNPDGKSPFIVRDGLLVSLGTPGGHLISDEEFANYRLEVEYRFAAKPGNCGVLVHASKPRALYDMFPQSIEVQMQSKEAGDFWCICENIETPDMETRRGPKENWGVDGDKLRRIKNLTDGSEKPPGEWNRMVVECLGDEVKVWVNGDLVNHGSKCTATKGFIALQAEGSEVEFRKVVLTPIGKLSEEAP
jgi:3-keto-disaccharide hydrolase